jgi:hypothetical protein
MSKIVFEVTDIVDVDVDGVPGPISIPLIPLPTTVFPEMEPADGKNASMPTHSSHVPVVGEAGPTTKLLLIVTDAPYWTPGTG